MAKPAPFLPAPVSGWPQVACIGTSTSPPSPDETQAALTKIRSEHLWWPAPRFDAVDARAVYFDEETKAAALSAGFSAREIADGNSAPLVRPEMIEAIFAPPGHPAQIFAQCAGLRNNPPDFNQTRWTCPWTGQELSLTDGVAAQSFLTQAARRNDRPMCLVDMSPWKRRCVTPFLTGPCGPPGKQGIPVVWGAKTAEQGVLKIEDGFLRSVGLGLRHTPPASLTFDTTAPYFDATQRNGFVQTVAKADFTPELLNRARSLRQRVLALRLSKYNLSGASSTLPTPPAVTERVLVVGQVESDASIRLGGAGFHSNRELLKQARAATPDAYIIYKPHPDVLTGLRPGDVADPQAFADHVETQASAPDCMDWAERIVTITSLMGFEALLRGRRVTTYGQPFYAGWGLTEDTNPPERDRQLNLDELTAATLILYPRYIDPVSKLPAPPEIVVERLATEMTAPANFQRQLRDGWRGAISWVMNRL